MPPTVAFELAPLGAPDTVENGLSRAERMLLPGGKKMPAGRQMEVAQQAWWGRMWREEQSPYRVIELNEEQGPTLPEPAQCNRSRMLPQRQPRVREQAPRHADHLREHRRRRNDADDEQHAQHRPRPGQRVGSEQR